MAHDSRSTKRRRTSSGPQSLVIIAPGESFNPANGHETFTRHADFWLDDGNLILLAGTTAFRIFRSLLVKKSAIFADMFATGTLDATETFDDCPVVRLSDHPEDLRDFLQYLMPCSEPKMHEDGTPLVSFSELHAAIHLAHKYQCPDIETRALFILKKYYTSHFAEYNGYSQSASTLCIPPRNAAIAAINIARLTETLSMLPFAFYLLTDLAGEVMDGYKRRDGSVEHLAAGDLRMCIGAQRKFAWELANLNAMVFSLTPGIRCKTATKCTGVRDMIYAWAQRRARGKCDALGFQRGFIRGAAHEFGLCKVCTQEIVYCEVEERRRVWMLLPETFGLDANDCNFTNGHDEDSDWDSD